MTTQQYITNITEDLIKDHKNGLLISQLHKKYDLDQGTIRKILKKLDLKKNLRVGSNNTKWTGYKEISGRYWGELKTGAKKRNFEFSISIEYIWNLFIKQDRKCALTGLEVTFDKIYSKDKSNRSYQTASLDRIDSSKGYIENNVQWVHKNINIMKWDLSQYDFIKMCDLISRYKLRLI